jgi:ribosomal protein S18 acetylase RimI-like enzyme
MTDAPLIGPVSSQHWAEVLALVFRDLLPEDRQQRILALLEDARSGRAPLDGLLAAHRGGRLVGGILSEVQAGRTAIIWPPRLLPDEPLSTGQQLMAATSEFLTAKRVCVAHALLEAGTEEDGCLFRAAGFERLSELVYLVSEEQHFPRSLPASPIEFEPYNSANHDRLARVVEATYEGTLDCPRLNGIRRTEDVLAGYRATGVFAAARWLLVRHQGEDVGCLILADHPQHENWELVYMGLVPAARGNGWGQDITRHAQWLTRRAGRPRLVLAVDAANQPAIRMYLRLGFHAWDRRSVYLKVLERSA